MELWDLVDKNRQVLDRVHLRENPLLPGEYHVCVQIWTINRSQEILLTLRHPDKKEYPNCWEATGGSILSGETSPIGAIRELQEETGILVKESELEYLGTIREATAFMDNYLVIKDVPIAELIMQQGETVSAKWVKIDQFETMIASGAIPEPIAIRYDAFRGTIQERVKKFAKPKKRK